MDKEAYSPIAPNNFTPASLIVLAIQSKLALLCFATRQLLSSKMQLLVYHVNRRKTQKNRTMTKHKWDSTHVLCVFFNHLHAHCIDSTDINYCKLNLYKATRMFLSMKKTDITSRPPCYITKSLTHIYNTNMPCWLCQLVLTCVCSFQHTECLVNKIKCSWRLQAYAHTHIYTPKQSHSTRFKWQP